MTLHRPFSAMLAGSGLLAATLMTACVGPAPDMSGQSELAAVAPAPETPPMAVKPDNTPSDQSPIESEMATSNAQPSAPGAPSEEEADMTVLVLENPELLAKAAPLPHPGQDDTTATPEKPAQTRFQFGFDEHSLSDQDKAVLREHGRFLAANPEYRMEVAGHTDAQGPDAYNQFLSRLRATAAARILKEAGARPEQIEILGFGSEQPVTEDPTAGANRRIELHYQTNQIAVAP
ncbi:OmpA family protein [Marinobacteraceae bacterium S3BR75-40.1]